MATHTMRAIAATLALAALAGAAEAQGKGQGKGKGEGKREGTVVTRSGGEVVRVPVATRRVPPGLAKKPGQMPPGQYKKLYSTADGARVLSDIFRDRGYVVTRLVTSGDSRVVYYRASDGTIRRAIVSPGEERLGFSNVPAAILREVVARLY
jgi:hypothetical protein